MLDVRLVSQWALSLPYGNTYGVVNVWVKTPCSRTHILPHSHTLLDRMRAVFDQGRRSVFTRIATEAGDAEEHTEA